MINKRRFRTKKNGEPDSRCFCTEPELIENYDKAVADTTQTWECHHRLETHNSDGEKRLIELSPEELVALGMYYNRPPEELIFLTKSEHTSLHFKEKIRGSFSEEHKRKLSDAKKGKHLSEEHKRKMAEAHKGKHHSEEAKKKMSESKMGDKNSSKRPEVRKKIAESIKGKHWYTNGVEDCQFFPKEVPTGWVIGRSKIKEKHWKLVDGKRVWY